jgi:hypothetical protein
VVRCQCRGRPSHAAWAKWLSPPRCVHFECQPVGQVGGRSWTVVVEVHGNLAALDWGCSLLSRCHPGSWLSPVTVCRDTPCVLAGASWTCVARQTGRFLGGNCGVKCPTRVPICILSHPSLIRRTRILILGRWYLLVDARPVRLPIPSLFWFSLP